MIGISTIIAVIRIKLLIAQTETGNVCFHQSKIWCRVSTQDHSIEQDWESVTTSFQALQKLLYDMRR